jgi:hypothetical protein
MKRTIWLAAGFGLGVYAGERMRRTVVKLTPDTFGERLRELVNDAIDAGKTEMHARERTLRETFAAPDRSGAASRPSGVAPGRLPRDAAGQAAPGAVRAGR